MSFSIVNNSALAVITSINTQTTTDGSFTVTSGSFPLFSGQTVSGTNTTIQNRNGSDESTILLFLQQGNAQINLYVNGTLISANDYSSGIIEVKAPILLSSDVISLQVDETELPSPSPTPTVTSTNTPTPSVTPPVTPTNTGTPTPTPSATLPAAQYKLDGVFNYPQDDATNVTSNTQFFYAKVGNNPFVLLSKSGEVAGLNNFFSGTGFVEISTGSTIDVILSANPQSGYYLTSYGGNGPWDEQRMTGFTWNGTNRWTGTTRFYSGGTQVYTETGGYIQLNSGNKTYSIGGTFGSYPDTGYFYVMPTP